MNLKKLPEAELEIMLVLWDADEEVNSDYLMAHLHKNWVKPTLLNLLTRLCDRGFVIRRKEGRFNLYKAAVKQEDYLEQETKGFLEKLHHGSLVSLVASLYDGKSITKNDLDELEKYIRRAK